jgi:hypothetical protein
MADLMTWPPAFFWTRFESIRLVDVCARSEQRSQHYGTKNVRHKS